MFIWLLLWFLFSAMVAMLATGIWGRGTLTWLLVALLVSPLVAMALLLVIADVLGPALDRASSDPSVPAAQRELPTTNQPPVAVQRGDDDHHTRACPRCGGSIHVKATTCMHCWAKVPGSGLQDG